MIIVNPGRRRVGTMAENYPKQGFRSRRLSWAALGAIGMDRRRLGGVRRAAGAPLSSWSVSARLAV